MSYYLKIAHAERYAPQYAFKCDPHLQPLDGFLSFGNQTIVPVHEPPI